MAAARRGPLELLSDPRVKSLRSILPSALIVAALAMAVASAVDATVSARETEWIELAGALVLLTLAVAMWHDHRRRHREHLRQQRLFESLLESLPVGVIAISRRDRTVRHMSSLAREITGVSTGIPQDQLPEQYLHPDGTPLAIEDMPVSQVLRNGKPTPPMEFGTMVSSEQTVGVPLWWPD